MMTEGQRTAEFWALFFSYAEMKILRGWKRAIGNPRGKTFKTQAHHHLGPRRLLLLLGPPFFSSFPYWFPEGPSSSIRSILQLHLTGQSESFLLTNTASLPDWMRWPYTVYFFRAAASIMDDDDFIRAINRFVGPFLPRNFILVDGMRTISE